MAPSSSAPPTASPAPGTKKATNPAPIRIGAATGTLRVMKLGLRDRVQAVIFAYEAGVVTPGA